MRRIRSFLSYCCLALAACLGFSGYAAADLRSEVITATRFAVADVGFHGAEAAKFQAEQAYAVSADSVELTTTGLLARESNGYRLCELVNVAVGDSEVAKGKTGVGAGNIA